MKVSIKSKRNLKFFIIILAIIGGFVYLRVYVSGVYSPKDDDLPPPIGPTNILPILFRFIPNPDFDGDVDVEWMGVVNASSYKIYRSDNGSKYVVIREQMRKSVLIYKYRDEGLSSGEYGYKITAIYNDKYSYNPIESDFSNIEFVTVQLRVF